MWIVHKKREGAIQRRPKRKVVEMTEISKAALERIMRRANAERISAGAVELLAELLEEFGIKITWDAAGLAKHAGRKTVKKEDIKLAARRSGPI